MNANSVIEFEKNDLVYCGSLRFIGWSDFKDEADVQARLRKVRAAIDDDWIGFFCKILARLERGNENELKSQLTIPFGDRHRWGQHVFSANQVIKAIASMEDGFDEPERPCWLMHFEQLARGNRLGNNKGLSSADGWTYVVADTSRSKYSIRLDYNENEKKNRHLLAGEIIYYGDTTERNKPRSAKVLGYGYDVWDKTWYETQCPPLRRLDGEPAIIVTSRDNPYEPIDTFKKWEKLFCELDGGAIHWKPERSAQSLANWVLSGKACRTIADELNKLTEIKDDPVRCFDRAEIECLCPFDSYPNPRRQDMGIWGRTGSGKTFFIGVEAKVDESFDKTLRETMVSAKEYALEHPDSQRATRIHELSHWFGIQTTDDFISSEDGNLRYQLLHFAKGTAVVKDVDLRIMLLVTFHTANFDSEKAAANDADWNAFLSKFFKLDSGEYRLFVPSEHNAVIAMRIDVNSKEINKLMFHDNHF